VLRCAVLADGSIYYSILYARYLPVPVGAGCEEGEDATARLEENLSQGSSFTVPTELPRSGFDSFAPLLVLLLPVYDLQFSTQSSIMRHPPM
jgi:hypothetical protein